MGGGALHAPQLAAGCAAASLTSVAEAAVNLFVAVILVSSLLYLLLVLMFGVETIGGLKLFAKDSSDIMISLLIIVGGVLILAFLVMFIGWLSKDEGGIMILPFEVAAGEEKYSGKAVSHLLTAELLRIRRIHKVKYKGISQISESFTFPLLAPTSEDLTYSISQMGPVGFGTTSIHLGPLMAILKRLWPWGDHGQVISGSLQRYGSATCLVACLEHQNIRSWEASNIKDSDQTGDEIIPALVSDLAFKMVHDLSLEGKAAKKITSKTWQGFKHFTEALEAYHQYNLTDDSDYLERARMNCLKAANSETGYEKLLKLLYNLGIAYQNQRDYFMAEELFLQTLRIKPEDSYGFFCLGRIYLDQDLFDKALDHFERAIELDPQSSGSWLGKGLALSYLGREEEAFEVYKMSIKIGTKYANVTWPLIGLYLSDKLGQMEEAIEALDKAIELNPKEDGLWLHKGDLFYKLGRTEEALESFEKAIELDPDNPSAWFNKGFVFGSLDRHEEALVLLIINFAT